jgi:L-seryl-tRNA(Ser) seleniumtransferase
VFLIKQITTRSTPSPPLFPYATHLRSRQRKRIDLLARPLPEIEALATRLLPAISACLGEAFSVQAKRCKSQVGSGSLPLETIESTALVIRPSAARGGGRALAALAAAFRNLPLPVIGRIEDQSLVLDLRCLENEKGFAENLAKLALSETADVRA